jgi:transcriptional regulator with XRE-family HTH domain
MDERVRQFFKAERLRQGLNQTAVALRGGATQGTISKIEIEPDYDPSVDSFGKALTGIGHTFTSFFAHIENVTPTTVVSVDPLPPAEQVATDERLSTQLPKDEGTLRVALAVLEHLTGALLRARDAAKVRGSAASDRADPPGRSAHRLHSARKDHRRANRRRRKD